MAIQQKTLTHTCSTSSNTIKFLYSYGGKILPRPSDGRLRYIGGLTRVISVPRSISFTELMAKLENLCGYSVTLRCQLPNEDLDVLISIKSNDDLINVIEEYDNAAASLVSGKELKIRAVLSPKSSTSSSSTSSSSPLSASPASSSSSLSSMGGAAADVSPTKHDHHHRRFGNQKPPMPVSRLSSKRAQYDVVRPVRDYYYYYPCHVQANFRPSPSYLQYSNRLH